ncbi:hypothetical protein NG99_04305 [Erwinia typographi]|uniref:Tail fiber assembly protein n=1 Tax=Erwinia typographi TaxID=371042 RepID=A0A0A3ZBR4_9GAMM|nr:tail fiber assembly protein [Erwinia typographi]KGT95249.1 hypothetical protein NG99_04305 [Erwinia typographi]
MKFYFSPSNLAFYQDAFRSYYDAAGSWPADVVEISEDVFNQFTCATPDGKVLTCVSGQPLWEDAPAPSQEERVATAEQRRAELRLIADKAVEPLQDAVDLNMATDAEIASLNAWKQYRVYLNRTDISLAPDIAWPEIPA